MLPMFLELYVFEYEQFIYIKDLKVMIMRRKKMELKYRKKKGEKKNNQYRFCTKIQADVQIKALQANVQKKGQSG